MDYSTRLSAATDTCAKLYMCEHTFYSGEKLKITPDSKDFFRCISGVHYK